CARSQYGYDSAGFAYW
nr:immunoglobulin heavy chain junction region [Mus musculus]MBK4186101.1 immunoglobulin heavy chain junction region [Mus musculus]MBK4186102.1 immunoglobulin heavy chain junction region [Mus musculus]MBK4186103.1 immunoglobulin heavy chain junction region [Mus musculus]MBK4186104.1 immunoglobulin heavy chain junction region [Mus musculus]